MKILGGYALVLAVFSGVYVLLFHLPVFAGQEILFYRGLSLLVVAMGVVGGIGEILRRKKRISGERLFAAMITAAAINLAVFVIFPVSFDRSVSMYLLNTLTTCQTEADLERKLLEEYIRQNRAVRRRIEEQKATGTVEESGECVRLTAGGKSFLKVSEIVKKVYAVK